MPFRLAARRALPAPAPTPLSRVVVLVRAHPYAQSKPPQAIFTNHLRRFHASATKCSEFAQLNHYERLGIRHDATPREVKKSFYSLSKSHHPDVNASPTAAHTFSLLSESYTVLSDPSRRAKYDADVLQLHHPHHHSHSHSHTHPPHSHYSHSHAGGRPASGLSKRRGTFRGPPPSFYRSGGWGTQSEKRRKAHDESTSSSSASTHDPWSHFSHGQGHGQGGMGPGAHPFGGRDHAPPHFDEAGHTRTHRRQDERRHERRRAMGDDDVEFEPQTSLTGHFFIVMGILAATMAAPLVYLQFMRLGRRRREGE